MGCGTSSNVQNGYDIPRNNTHHKKGSAMPEYYNDEAEYIPEPDPEPEPQPVKDLSPEPQRDPEPTPEPKRDPTPEPKRDPTPEPVKEPEPEPNIDPDVPIEKQGDDPNRRWRRKPPKFDDDPTDPEEVDGYKYTELSAKGSQFRMGRVTVTIDTRKNDTDDSDVRPSVPPGELWEDPDFTEDQALDGEVGVYLKRPKDLCDAPALYTEGTTRFDIVQGKVGSCYFLSVIASLADKPDFLKQARPAILPNNIDYLRFVDAMVIPEGEYDPSSPDYDGVFRVRFWQFGKWIDVYVDDRIPVKDTGSGYQPWGAKSCDPNEMWVSLMEKAYAKYHGSYKAVFGGLAGDAFLTLTGGVAENIKHKDDIGKPGDFFIRVGNALRGGSLVSSSVPETKDGYNGLAGGHAYTVTGSGRVNYRGTTQSLLRIRNPWGSEKGEWTGPWSDNAEEWQQVSDDTKEALHVQGRGDGEFWMTLQDFLEQFAHTFICNFTPDFDRDGIDDGLENVCSMIGEWSGATAVGSDAEKKFQNPKFELTVPDNVGAEGTTPVVIQCLQNKLKRLNGEFEYVRVDLYKMDKKLQHGMTVYDEITNFLSYQGGQEVVYRYNLQPGNYVILPTTLDAGKERQFLIRTFSSISLSCKEITEKFKPIVRKCDMDFEYNNKTYLTDELTYTSCRWQKGHNAGGQISNNSFYTNPQYRISLSGSDTIPLTILLIQQMGEAQAAVGWKIFKDSGVELPMTTQTIYQLYSSSLTTTEDEQVFVFSYEAEGTYMLEPGHYVMVAFTDQADTEKDFVLCFGTSKDNQLSFTEYNT